MNAGRNSDGYGPPVDSEISLNISTCCDRTSLISVCDCVCLYSNWNVPNCKRKYVQWTSCSSLNEPQGEPLRATFVSNNSQSSFHIWVFSSFGLTLWIRWNSHMNARTQWLMISWVMTFRSTLIKKANSSFNWRRIFWPACILYTHCVGKFEPEKSRQCKRET